MVRNWKTTLAAFLLNAALLTLTMIQSGNVSARDILLAVGIQVIAALAKDYNVSGQ